MDHADAIDRADDGHPDHPDEIRGQQADDQGCGEQAGQRDEEHLETEACQRSDPERIGPVFENGDDRHGDDAGEAVLKIHRGLELAAFCRGVAVLHPGVEWREEQCGGKSQQGEGR